uniref:Uncharacterized protein n=1 Tax=Oryza rufipogon TaxID=4529 RepID=A0A0E0NHN0_ORYRU
MQGSGILFDAIVALAVSAGFPHAYPVSSYSDNHAASLIPQADYVWRIIVMFGTVPAALTYYWRMKMPETAWYTALIARNTKQAVADMSKVLHTQIEESVGHAETVRRWSSAARPEASSRASSCAATASTSSPPPAHPAAAVQPDGQWYLRAGEAKSLQVRRSVRDGGKRGGVRVAAPLAHVKLPLCRRTAAVAALDSDLPAEAVRHFSKVLDACRGGLPYPFATACLVGRAEVFRSFGKAADAIADCNRALALDPPCAPDGERERKRKRGRGKGDGRE